MPPEIITWTLKRKALGGYVIKYQCPACLADLTSPIANAGRIDDCPDCATTYLLPSAAADEYEHFRTESAAQKQRRREEREAKNQTERERAEQERSQREAQIQAQRDEHAERERAAQLEQVASVPPRRQQQSKTAPCPDCGHEVSRLAPNCPSCGRPIAGEPPRAAARLDGTGSPVCQQCGGDMRKATGGSGCVAGIVLVLGLLIMLTGFFTLGIGFLIGLLLVAVAFTMTPRVWQCRNCGYSFKR